MNVSVEWNIACSLIETIFRADKQLESDVKVISCTHDELSDMIVIDIEMEEDDYCRLTGAGDQFILEELIDAN